MIVFFAIEPPHLWAVSDGKNGVVQRGTLESLSSLEIPKGATKIVAVAPATDVLIRTVSIPARSRSKAFAAIPYALEDSLASEVEQLHFALLDWHPGAEAKVAVVARSKMDQWVQVLDEQAFTVDGLIPEYLLLPLHPQAGLTVARTAADMICIRNGLLEGLVLDNYALEFWWRDLDRLDTSVACQDVGIARQLVNWGGTMVREWNIGNDFTEWLNYSGDVDIDGDLLQGRYKSKHRRRGLNNYMIAATVVAVALGVRLIADAYEYLSLASQAQSLDRRISETFRNTFPDVTRIVNPKLQMEQKIKQLQTGIVGEGEFQSLLSTVARAVPATQAQVTEVSFRSNSMIVTCVTKDFAGLDRLKEAFAKDPGFQVELLSSGSRDNRVSGRFKIERVEA